LQQQLQEPQDSVLARPRVRHLIAAARMLLEAELSFGEPARAPHALAAVMEVCVYLFVLNGVVLLLV